MPSPKEWFQRNKKDWLLKEIPQWEVDGLISRDQAQLLRQKYQTSPENSQYGLDTIIISVIGALLIGLGIILFFAWNWKDMPRWSKVSLILVSMVSSYLGGFYIKYQKPAKAWLGETLTFLGLMIFGAGIWLMYQMFNYSLDTETGFFYWAMGALLVTLTAESIPALLSAIILGFCWFISNSSIFIPSQYQYASYLILVIPLMGISYYWKCRFPLHLQIIFLLIATMFKTFGHPQNLITLTNLTFLGLIICSLGLLSRSWDTTHSANKPLLNWGRFITGLGLFISCVSLTNINTDISNAVFRIRTLTYGFLGTFILLALLRGVLLSKKRLPYPELKLSQNHFHFIPDGIGLAAFIIVSLFAGVNNVFNFFMIVLIIYYYYLLIHWGNQIQKMIYLYMGTIGILATAFYLYYEFFSGTLLRGSLFFLVAGASFIMCGWWLIKKRRQFKLSDQVEVFE